MTKSETDLCHFQEGGHLSFAIQDSDFIGRWVFRHSSFHPDLLRTNLPLPTWVFGSEPQDVTRGTSKTTSRMSHVGHGAGTTRRHTWDTGPENHEMSHVGHPQLRSASLMWDRSQIGFHWVFRHSSFQPSLLRPKLPLSMWHAGPNPRMSTPRSGLDRKYSIRTLVDDMSPV